MGTNAVSRRGFVKVGAGGLAALAMGGIGVSAEGVKSREVIMDRETVRIAGGSKDGVRCTPYERTLELWRG